MVLLNSHILLLTHSLTTLTIAYLLLASPGTLMASQSLWILGESMHIRPLSLPLSKTSTSETLALVALVLALSSITQAFFAGGLAPIAPTVPRERPKTDAEARAATSELGEKVFALRFIQNQWMGLAGVRVLALGGLVGWIYVFHSERNQSMNLGRVSGFGLLANRVVFTAAMTDMLFWGYLWTVVREEGRLVMEMVVKMRDDGMQMD